MQVSFTLLVAALLSSLCHASVRSAVAPCEQADEQYNVQFIINVDQSGTVGRSDYQLSLDFIQDIIQNDLAPDARVSAIAVGSDYVYRFSQDQSSRSAVLEAIEDARSVVYERSDGLCTGDAIHKGLADFTSNTLIRQGSANVAIMISDGSTAPVCMNGLCTLKPAMNAAGVKLYVVGIGQGFKQQSKDRLQCVVDDIETDLISSVDVTDAFFAQAESSLREIVCADAGKESKVAQAALVVEQLRFKSENSAVYIIMSAMVLTVIGIVVYYKCNAMPWQSVKPSELTPLSSTGSCAYA